jgi:RNA polymerase sigma factor (sigma-70 family)
MQPRLLKHPARLAGASLLRLQDDKRLVALAREGHDPAFAAIVDRYGAQLERYCARILGPGRAEDAVQQAFVNAHAAMRASDQELALKPWLYRIAHNAALNVLRAAGDEGDVLDEDRAGTTHTADIVELRERLRETLASIQALPRHQRDALLLREIEGLSHEDIALALGVSAGGARQHLHRARIAVRAAASAITPYPVLARVLSAAASEGGRGADIVSGAGLGAGAGAMKAAAGMLAAGAIAGGAVTAHHHTTRSTRTTAEHTTVHRSTNASSATALPSGAAQDAAGGGTAGAGSRHGRGHGRDGARGRRHGNHAAQDRRGRGQGEHSLGVHRETEVQDHHGGSGERPALGETEIHREGSGSGSSGSSGSGSGDGHIGTSGGHGSDDLVTESSGTGGSGSDDSLSSNSGPGGGDTTATTPTTTVPDDDHSGSGHGSDDPTTTVSDG